MGREIGGILTVEEQAKLGLNFPPVFFFHNAITKATLGNTTQVMCKIISTEGNIIGDLLKSIHGLLTPSGSETREHVTRVSFLRGSPQCTLSA